MTLKSFVQFAIAASILSLSASSFAEDTTEITTLDRPFKIETDHETVTAINPVLGPIEKQNKEFSFNWNQSKTITPNQKKVPEVEKFLAKLDDTSHLNKYDKVALGEILYKLGTYYTHVARDPNSAITKLTSAEPFLNTKEEKIWNDNQLAYAYELRYSLTKQSADKEKSLYYTNKVLSQHYAQPKNQMVAFAQTLKGLIESDDKDYVPAEKHFQTALAIYKTLPNYQDNQYARVKNRLANAILDQSSRDQEALSMLKQLKKYWSAQGSTAKDPYAARNLLSLGHAYLKTGNAKAARDEFKMAVNIYKNVYGANNTLLARPYQLLAESYRALGSQEEALNYEKKASEIVKA